MGCQSASTPAASKACRREALERVKEGTCRLVKWNDKKHNPPKNLKISPIAAIPHKSRDYRMILNLAYNLKLNNKNNLDNGNITRQWSTNFIFKNRFKRWVLEN